MKGFPTQLIPPVLELLPVPVPVVVPVPVAVVVPVAVPVAVLPEPPVPPEPLSSSLSVVLTEHAVAIAPIAAKVIIHRIVFISDILFTLLG